MVEGVIEWLAELPGWAHAAIVIGLSVALGAAIDRLFRYLEVIAEGVVKLAILSRFRQPMSLTALMLGIYASRTFIELDGLEFMVGAAALTVILFVWTWGLIRVGGHLLERRDHETLKFAPVLTNVLTFFALIAAAFILLQIWQIDLTPLLASAGLVGVIVGYAARDTINNFVSGVSLYFDQTYKVGDMISMPTGERGTVIDISIRSTTILTRDNVTVTIPNAEFNRQQVTNESAPQRHRRLNVEVGVAYGSDLEAVEESLLSAAETVEVVIESPPPRVHFKEFANSSIVAILRVYIADPASVERGRHELVRAINQSFKRDDVKIPFPQREVSFYESENRLVVDDRRTADDTEPS